MIGRNPYDSGNDMTADKVSRLSQRAFYGAVNQNSGGSKGADDHKEIGLIEKTIVDKGHSGHTQKGPYP